MMTWIACPATARRPTALEPVATEPTSGRIASIYWPLVALARVSAKIKGIEETAVGPIPKILCHSNMGVLAHKLGYKNIQWSFEFSKKTKPLGAEDPTLEAQEN
eukprot:Polyplicarium_translucidae@DN3515_c0_g1_i1.p1